MREIEDEEYRERGRDGEEEREVGKVRERKGWKCKESEVEWVDR